MGESGRSGRVGFRPVNQPVVVAAFTLRMVII